LSSGGSEIPKEGQFPKEVVEELVNMGFREAQIHEALTVCNGDKEQAANYLMNSASSP